MLNKFFVFDHNVLALSIKKTKVLPLVLRDSSGRCNRSFKLHTCREDISRCCSYQAVINFDTNKNVGL